MVAGGCLILSLAGSRHCRGILGSNQELWSGWFLDFPIFWWFQKHHGLDNENPQELVLGTCTSAISHHKTRLTQRVDLANRASIESQKTDGCCQWHAKKGPRRKSPLCKSHTSNFQAKMKARRNDFTQPELHEFTSTGVGWDSRSCRCLA